MKNKLFVSLIILLMISVVSVLHSQVVSLEQTDKVPAGHGSSLSLNLPDYMKNVSPWSEVNLYSARINMLKSPGVLDMTQIKQNVNGQPQKEKSIWIGGGLSLLIPGAGEYYAKSYVKAAIFLGVEAICWGAYAYYNHKGNKQTDDFQNFANQNWNVHQYAQWLVDQQFTGYGQIVPNEQDRTKLWNEIHYCEEQSGFAHTLPDYGTQQYYELIGKYQEYVSGWPDARDASGWLITKQNYETYRSPIFISYAYSRQLANTYYNDGQTGAMIALLNHVLSAADAIWSVSIFNKNLKVQTGMEIRRELSPYTFKMESIPTFNVNISF
ncbi:MAG: hypothetical protein ABSF32_03930 [Ignavibacteria bacterium]|jgi:hypothetical protein